MDRLSTGLLAAILAVLVALSVAAGIFLASYNHKPAWQPNRANCNAVTSSVGYSSQDADRLSQCIDWEASQP